MTSNTMFLVDEPGVRAGPQMRRTVCVQGLGFVGSAMAVALAAARTPAGDPAFQVVGVDLPTSLGRERIAALRAGRFPFASTDDNLAASAEAAVKIGNLSATDDPDAYSNADVVVVDIDLDVDLLAKPASVDFTRLRSAVKTVGERIKPGALVVVETTVPPGTCATIIAPLLEECARIRGLAPDAFLLAHSYERVMPGDQYLASIVNFWRVYAGHTEAAAQACERFLSSFINVAGYPLTRVASTTASETAKVMENSYRAVNIAFIEEWARFAEAVGIDLFEIIDAIRMRPTHNNIRQPGFGVGGYCLTKDPLLPGIAARSLFGKSNLSFPFSEKAVAINQEMPLVSVEAMTALLGNLTGRRLLVLGVAYRQDIGDTRYSPAETFVLAARKAGARIEAHDPMVSYWQELGMEVHSGAVPSAADFDGVVFCVPHRAYRDLDVAAWLAGSKAAVLDANRVLNPAQLQAVRDAGCALRVIGRGAA